MTLSLPVPPHWQGRKLGNFLRFEMGLSTTLVRRLKVNGGILVNGQSRFTNYRLQEGETVSALLLCGEQAPDYPPEKGPLSILYEDEGLLAVHKAPGILVHPSASRLHGTLAAFVSAYLQKSEGNVCCHAVNRLDRDTSGVILFSKNSHMKDILASSLRSPLTQKIYLGIVAGVPARSAGVIRLPIRRVSDIDQKRIISPDGQRAVTHYRLLSTLETEAGPISLVQFRLETGRTHQIRVHCLSSGFPILGDRLYYTEYSQRISGVLGLSSQLLHAHTLGFVHPLTGKYLTIEAKPERKDMQNLLSRFKPV